MSDSEKTRIYSYIMVYKNHCAPTVQYDININKYVLSLALCKPQIRTSAKIGDIIFGFGSKACGNNGELVYVCKITEIIEAPYYYLIDKYFYRRDCRYRIIDNKLFDYNGENLEYERKNSIGQVSVNIGTNFKKARVILSTNFKTFFKDGSSKNIMEMFPEIKEKMCKKGRGIGDPHLYSKLLSMYSILKDIPTSIEEDPE